MKYAITTSGYVCDINPYRMVCVEQKKNKKYPVRHLTFNEAVQVCEKINKNAFFSFSLNPVRDCDCGKCDKWDVLKISNGGDTQDYFYLLTREAKKVVDFLNTGVIC